MVIRSARGPFDCFHFSNLTLEVVVYHKLYHISRHAQLELAVSCSSACRLAARAGTGPQERRFRLQSSEYR